MREKVTMDDIALAAGVSKSTVSRALRSPHLVNSRTVAQIRKIAEEKGYVYDVVAAGFSRDRTPNIGLIVPTVEDSIQAGLINGAQDRTSALDYGLLIGYSHHSQSTALSLIRLFRERRVSGIVLAGMDRELEVEARAEVSSDIPIVVTWDTPRKSKLFSYVGFDNYAAAYDMTEYLCGLGHKRIAQITGPRLAKTKRTQERNRGYIDALKASLGDSAETFYVDTSIPTLANGREAMTRILSSDFRPTAVFAAGDALAIGALRAIKDAGLRIPEDISVAGFDDTDFAAYSDPPLTTVRVSQHEMGSMAVDLIVDSVTAGVLQPRQYMLDPAIVVRASCRRID